MAREVGDDPSIPDQTPVTLEFADIWRAADKIVYSKTLEAVSSTRTRIERDFDPWAVREATAAADITVGGPGLAAQAIGTGLVDDYHLFLNPIVVGGGKQWLPDDVRGSWSWWTNAVSGTAWSTSTTAYLRAN